MEWWEVLLGVFAGLAGVYLILLLALWIYARRHPETVGMKDTLRLLPDLLRVLRRLAADNTVPPGVRIKLSLLLAYLLLPLDLVPDFLPVIGYADDVIIVALVLRSVVRSAGPEPLRRHWPGTPTGLKIIEQLAGLNPSSHETRRGTPKAGHQQPGRMRELIRGKLAPEERHIDRRTQKMLYMTAGLLALAGIGFFLLTLAEITDHDDLAAWDGPVTSWFVSHRSPAATVVMGILATIFGPVAMPIIVLAVTVAWTITARHAWRPLLLAGAMLTGVILAQVLTRLIGRPRPPLNLMLLGSDSTYSFPSGHVLGVSDFLLVGAYLIFSRRKRLGPAIAGFLTAATAIIAQAISRLYLGYHWLTDALGSIALSLTVLAAVIALDTWRTTRVRPELNRELNIGNS